MVVNFIKWRLDENFPDDTGRKIVEFQHLFTLVQTVISFYLTFIGYHKSPQWAGLRWIKVGPWIHLFALVLSMVVIPILVIVQTLSSFGEIH